MGFAIASAFLKKGYPTTVWNRTTEKARPLASQGATVADCATDCAQSSSLLIICLLSNQVLRDVLDGIPIPSRCTVLNFTSSTPRQVKETAEMVTRVLGASGHLHGWIMCPPSEIHNHQAMISYGGPRSVFEKHKRACEILGTASWISEDPQRVALIENGAMTMAAGLFAGFLQSLAIFKRDEVDLVLFTRDVLLPQLQIFQEWLPRLAQQDQELSHRASGDATSFRVASNIVTNATETANECGISKQLFQGLADILVEGVEAGKGPEDISAVIEMLRK
jgi:hypothetical protein